MQQRILFFCFQVIIFSTCIHSTFANAGACGAETTYCPTYCNSTGQLQPGRCCLNSPFCCQKDDDTLACCHSKDNQIDSVVTDGWNCPRTPEENRLEAVTVSMVLLGAALAVFVGISTGVVFVAQKMKRRRIRRNIRGDSTSSCSCDTMEAPATSNPVDDVILSPLPDDNPPPPYSLLDSNPRPRILPDENPPGYEEIETSFA